MTFPPPLVDANGRPFPLDRQLASGGEGAVFTLPHDLTRVAKVYHRPPSTQTAEKLVAMIGLANKRLDSLAAWPTGLLRHAQTRQPHGFVMLRLSDDYRTVQELYNPVQRLKYFPLAGWDFQLQAALKLAAAFDEVHKINCLVGDVNERNALVSWPQALIQLIDCDSFQVQANGKLYRGEVGVEHYTPPELQEKSFHQVVRTQNHDRFGLAVLIYQLLFVGRHPYVGMYGGPRDLSFKELIAQFRFAQGPVAKSRGITPPPHTPTFADIPEDVGTLLRRAFEEGSEAGWRPSPSEWISALKRLENALVKCKSDPGHTYWRGAASCVWCRFVECGGPEYYSGVDGGAAAFSVDEAKLQDVLRRLAGAEWSGHRYDRNSYRPARPPQPTPLPDDLYEHRNTVIVLAVVTGLCLFAVPFWLVSVVVGLSGLLGAMVFSTWLTILVLMSPWYVEWIRRRRAYTEALDALEVHEADWDQIVRRYRRDFSDLHQRVTGRVSECRGLTPRHVDELRRLTANAEAASRLRHLRLHLIADAEIRMIGAGRKQILAANNVNTAADIDEHTIRRIKGFGDTLTASLLAWRQAVAQQFQFNPKTAVTPADQRAVTVRYQTQQNLLLAEVARQLEKLEGLATECRASIQTLIPTIRAAVVRYERANAELRLLTGWR